MRKVLAVMSVSLALAGCVQQGGQGYGSGYGSPGYAGPGEIGMNKTTGGGLIGAGLGGLAGSQLGHGSGKGVMTVLGVLAGGLVGSQVGASLDRADLNYANQATQTSLETAPPGQALPWRNPQSGNSGTITPQRYYQNQSGHYCREFQQTISVAGQTQQGYGTACRQPDGSWKIVEQ